MKHIFILGIVACFMHHSTWADPQITFFMRPYPTATPNEFTQELSSGLKKPGAIASHRLHGILNKCVASGINSIGYGYLATSDCNGQTSFPRKYENPLVYFVITNHIAPNVITQNTLHHWELEPGKPAAMYKAERKHDPQSTLYYWNVENVDLPADNRIPLEAIVILSQPKYVFVPTGISVTNDSPNLVLPTIYIKKGIKIYQSTLYLLNIRQFFGQTNPEYKQIDKGYIMHLAPEH